ncbi:hypothetical protein glysoja_019776 [Glycine soja]|nr:hypothetical protein glysoja_019776 [Glycine soja]
MMRRVQRWRCVWNCIDRPSQQLRLLHEGPDTVEELLERHLVKNKNENQLENQRQLTSTRREALCLYRDILRATRLFIWPDSFESDPEIVTRLLIGGRQALHSAIDKLAEKHKQR